MKRIVLSGYYGFGNAGDEAVLAGLVQSLRAEANADDLAITALSIDPPATIRDHDIHAAHRMRLRAVVRSLARADLLASGGGSLLQDVTSRHGIFYYLAIVRLAQIMGKRTMFVAQGIGPLVQPRSRNLTAAVANRLDAITVRDSGSAALLREIGVRSQIEVTADPALVLAPRSVPAGGFTREGVAVALRAFRPWRDNDLVSRVAFAWRAALGDEPLVPMSMQPGVDDVFARWLSEALGRQAPVSGADLWEHVETVRRVRMVIGMRLHALVLAAGARTPMVALSYDPKVAAFMAEIGQPDAVFDLASFDAAALTRLTGRIWEEREARTAALEAAMPRIEARARRNALAMLALLG